LIRFSDKIIKPLVEVQHSHIVITHNYFKINIYQCIKSLKTLKSSISEHLSEYQHLQRDDQVCYIYIYIYYTINLVNISI